MSRWTTAAALNGPRVCAKCKQKKERGMFSTRYHILKCTGKRKPYPDSYCKPCRKIDRDLVKARKLGQQKIKEMNHETNTAEVQSAVHG